jgi:hypothetical protein
VPVSSEQFQTTPLTPGRASAEAAGRPAKKVARDPDRIGVLLVHGIGAQAAAETFLDWSRPVVELLADWRRDHGFDVDPVRRAQYSFNGASLPFLELDIPAFSGHAPQTWVVTEAWWATQLRPNGLGTVTTYLRHGLGKILQGIRAGYEIRENAWMERVRDELAARGPSEGKGTGDPEVAGALEGSLEAQRRQADLIGETLAGSTQWSWIRGLDSIQKWLTILGLGPALLLGTVVLALYSPLRAIPFKPLRDLAILRTADNFLVQWFGDLPILLEDPVQSANVRARTAEAIDGLVAQGCGRIVIVAHSGGAIVGFTTLLDPVYADRHVDKLITLGQGLGLAWHLEERTWLLDKGNRLAGDLAASRPDLVWYDFWASYDPAPGGPLVHPRGLPLPVISRPVTNRMSIIEDHGAYWQNDEGFLIPLIRQIDTAGGRAEEGSGSRFFPDSGQRAAFIERRRERVGVLALWRWIAVLGAAVPIVLATLLAGPARAAGMAGLGRSAAAFWGTVPAHEILNAPVAWLAGIIGGPTWMQGLGEWLVGAALIALLFLVMGLIGLRSWRDWDARERHIAHAAAFQPIDRRVPFASFLVLVLSVTLLAEAVTWALLR